MTLVDTGSRIIDVAARRAGNVQCEAFLLQTQSWAEEWSEGEPENRVLAKTEGVGLRVIDQGRLGFGYSNRLDSEAIDQLVTQALAAARNTAPDPLLEMPTAPKTFGTPDLSLTDTALMGPVDETRASFLASVQGDVLRRDKRFTKVLRASYREGRHQSAVVSTRGISACHEGTSASFSLACVAVEEGETQIGYGFQAKRHYRDLEPKWVVQQAADHTLSLLGGRQVPSGRYDLVLDPLVAAEVLELFAGVVQGDQVLKGKSFLATKVGETIGASCVTLVDDGRLSKGLGSSLFDGEGLPTQRTVVIERGVLKGFLFDSYNARKAKTYSTGNAGRASYRSAPGPESTNFYMEPGRKTPEQLMAEIKSGIYVRGVMGLHTVDTVSGDYSLGLMGQRIENGRLTHGVRRVTMAGNMLDFLKNVRALGSDLTFAGSVGSPTLWIGDVSVGGS